MSTTMYLRCVTHDPYISSDEVGHNESALPEIRNAIRDPLKIVEIVERLDGGFWDLDFDDTYKRNLWYFIWNHRNCEIEIWDEYGRHYPMLEGPEEKPITISSSLGEIESVVQDRDGVRVKFFMLSPEGKRILSQLSRLDIENTSLFGKED